MLTESPGHFLGPHTTGHAAMFECEHLLCKALTPAAGTPTDDPAVSTKRCDGVLRCKSKREKWRAGRGWLHHLKIGRTSCSDATIKLKDDIDRRARDAPDEP